MKSSRRLRIFDTRPPRTFHLASLSLKIHLISEIYIQNYLGVKQLSTCAKGNDFARLRHCRLKAQARKHRSKKLNANDNFANDNFEFAPVALAA